MSTNNAATVLVRDLLARLEEGSAEVLELAAGDGLLSVKFANIVLERSTPPTRAPTPRQWQAGEAHSCGRVVMDASGSLFCPGCGTVG